MFQENFHNVSRKFQGKKYQVILKFFKNKQKGELFYEI